MGLKVFKVDDPVQGIAVNISGGVMGALVSGILSLIHTRNGQILGWEMIGVVSVTVWVILSSLLIMLPLLLCGKLRVKDHQERNGMDSEKIYEQAYGGVHSIGYNPFQALNYKKTQSQNVSVSFLEKERSPQCALVSPCVRQQLRSQSLQREGEEGDQLNDVVLMTPRILVNGNLNESHPSHQLEVVQVETSLSIVEKSGRSTSSDCLQEKTESHLSSSATYPSSKSLASEVRDLRATLKAQKENLKAVNSSFRPVSINSEDEGGLNVDTGLVRSLSQSSDASIHSDVIRQAASNKVNFNYLAGSKVPENEASTEKSGNNCITNLNIGPDTTRHLQCMGNKNSDNLCNTLQVDENEIIEYSKQT